MMAHLEASARTAAERSAELVAVLRPRRDDDEPRLGVSGMSVDDPADLDDVEMVADLLRSYGEPEPVRIERTDIAEMRTVADDLWLVFAAETADEAANRLNTILNAHSSAPRLSRHDGTAWHLHVDSRDDAPWAEWFASSSAMALAVLLADRQENPAGLCASPTCGRPFIDSGHGDVRRFCSSRCASRQRVAEFRRRQREQNSH